MEAGSPHLSVAIVATSRRQRQCHAILARAGEPSLRSQGLGFGDAPAFVRRRRPSVLLLDAVPSPLRALRVLPALRRLSPTTGIIIIGPHRTPAELILEGLRRGAWGHIAENDLPRDLLKAVRSVVTRQAWIPRRLGAAIVDEIRAGHRSARRASFRLIQGGLFNRQESR